MTKKTVTGAVWFVVAALVGLVSVTVRSRRKKKLQADSPDTPDDAPDDAPDESWLRRTRTNEQRDRAISRFMSGPELQHNWENAVAPVVNSTTQACIGTAFRARIFREQITFTLFSSVHVEGDLTIQGRETLDFHPLSQSTRIGAEVIMLGLPFGQRSPMMLRGHIAWMDSTAVRLDITAVPGYSGSPVLYYNERLERWFVFAVVSSQVTDADALDEKLVDLDDTSKVLDSLSVQPATLKADNGNDNNADAGADADSDAGSGAGAGAGTSTAGYVTQEELGVLWQRSRLPKAQRVDTDGKCICPTLVVNYTVPSHNDKRQHQCLFRTSNLVGLNRTLSAQTTSPDDGDHSSLAADVARLAEVIGKVCAHLGELHAQTHVTDITTATLLKTSHFASAHTKIEDLFYRENRIGRRNNYQPNKDGRHHSTSHKGGRKEAGSERRNNTPAKSTQMDDETARKGEEWYSRQKGNGVHTSFLKKMEARDQQREHEIQESKTAGALGEELIDFRAIDAAVDAIIGEAVLTEADAGQRITDAFDVLPTDTVE